MSIFDKLFGAKKMKTGKPITLNLHEGGFELNGKQINEPDSLEKALDLFSDIIFVASSQQYGE